MQIKKAGGKIFGMTLTTSEQKAMDMEIRRRLADYERKHEIEMDSLILWQLHKQLGFGPKRLRKFYDNFAPAMDELLKQYEAEDSECFLLCAQKLKECGIDVEKWHNER